MTRRIRRPSAGGAALIVSVLALVVALVGTAFSDGGSQVPGKNGVLSSDIKKKNVKGKDLANIVVRQKTGTIDDSSGNGLWGVDEVTVNCEGKEKILSGGLEFPDEVESNNVHNSFVGQSFKDGNGWTVWPTTDEGDTDYIVYAYCLK